MLARAFRAMILDRRLYHDVGDEPQEMFSSLFIVLIAAAAFGLGMRNIEIVTVEGASTGMIFAMAASSKITSWVIWAALAYLLGRVLGGRGGFRQLLRNLGFTFGPGVLAILFEVPIAGTYIWPLSFLWLFPAGLVAIKETHEIDWVRATIVNIVGWSIGIFLVPAVLLPFNPSG